MAFDNDSTKPNHEPASTDAPQTTDSSRFRFVTSLGLGAMGSVCLAEDTRLNRRVAIKSFRRELSNDPGFHRRIEQECLVHAKVGTHTHIVTLYDCVESDDQIHLVMEYVDGKTLQAILDRTGSGEVAFPVGRVLDIGHQCLDALSRIHERGIIHRDVNPAKIMIAQTESGGVSAKLMGFGVARMMGDGAVSNHESSDASEPGTPPYMAPEQVEPDRFGIASPATDVYAMGVLLFELLAGSPPFAGTLTDMLDAMVNRPAPRLDIITPSRVPPILADVIDKALAKRPQDRYVSAREFQVELLRSRIEIMQPEVNPGQWVVPQMLDVNDSSLSRWFAEAGVKSRPSPECVNWGRFIGAFAAGFLLVAATAVIVLASLRQDSDSGDASHAAPVAASPEVLPAAIAPPALPAPTLTPPVVEREPDVPEPAAPEPLVIPRRVGPAPQWYIQLAQLDWGAATQDAPVRATFVPGDPDLARIIAEAAVQTLERVDAPSVELAEEPVVEAEGPADSPASREYVVRTGDSLSTIAGRHGVSVRDLQWWNEIPNPDSILAGQTLRLYQGGDLPSRDRFFAQLARASQPALESTASARRVEQPPPLVADTAVTFLPAAGEAADTNNPFKKIWRKLRGKD